MFYKNLLKFLSVFVVFLVVLNMVSAVSNFATFNVNGFDSNIKKVVIFGQDYYILSFEGDCIKETSYLKIIDMKKSNNEKYSPNKMKVYPTNPQRMKKVTTSSGLTIVSKPVITSSDIEPEPLPEPQETPKPTRHNSGFDIVPNFSLVDSLSTIRKIVPKVMLPKTRISVNKDNIRRAEEPPKIEHISSDFIARLISEKQCNFAESGAVIFNLGVTPFNPTNTSSYILKLNVVSFAVNSNNKVEVYYKYGNLFKKAQEKDGFYTFVYPVDYTGERKIMIVLEGDGEYTPVIRVDAKSIPSDYDVNMESLTINKNVSVNSRNFNISFEDVTIETTTNLSVFLNSLTDLFGGLIDYKLTEINDDLVSCTEEDLNYNCHLNGYFVGEKDLTSSIELLVPDPTDTSKTISLPYFTLNMTLDINYPEPNSDTNAVKFSVDNLAFDLKLEGDSVSYDLNLKQYLKDDDGTLSSYSLNIIQGLGNCTLSNDVLSCTFSEAGVYRVIVDVNSLGQIDDLNIDYNVYTLNSAPTINFSGENKTLIDGQLSYSWDLSATDPDGENLTFSYNAIPNEVNDPSLEVNCNYNSNLGKVNCNFYSNEGNGKDFTGAFDLNFCFSDSEDTVCTSPIKFSHVSLDDFKEMINLDVNSAPYKVAPGSSFDYIYYITNASGLGGVGFDLWNLDLNYGFSAFPELKDNINVTFNDTHVDHVPYSTSSIYQTTDGYALKFHIDIDSSIAQEHDVNLNLYPLGHNESLIYKPNLYAERDSNSSFHIYPLTREIISQNNLLDLQLHIPGHRPDGHDNYLPSGVKVALPYYISNNYDVDLNLWVCRGAEILGSTGMVWRKVNNLYVEYYNGYCDYFNLSPKSDLLVYNFLSVYNGDATPFVILSKTDLTNNLTNFYSGYFPGELERVDIINFEYDSINNPIAWLSSTIESPSPGSTLQRNHTYDLNVKFTNDYAFDLVDVNVCGLVGKSNSLSWTTMQWSFDNSYLKINPLKCKTLPVIHSNGYIHSDFSFNTKDNTIPISGNGEYFVAIGSGYVINNNNYVKGRQPVGIE